MNGCGTERTLDWVKLNSGRWLGVSHRTGTLMSYWILTQECQVLSRTTVQRVTNLELQTDENKSRCKVFNDTTQTRIGNPDYFTADGKVIPGDWQDYDPVDLDDEFIEEFKKVISDESIPEADREFTPDAFDDTYLNMELALPRNGAEVEFAKVTKRLRDKNGLPIGTANDNPILDTRIYEVEFPDGHEASLAANIIAENLYAQVDIEGNRHVLFQEIVGHRTNGTEIKQLDAFCDRFERHEAKAWKLRKDGKSSCNGRTAARRGLHSRT